jgi:hypothetical protein
MRKSPARIVGTCSPTSCSYGYPKSRLPAAGVLRQPRCPESESTQAGDANVGGVDQRSQVEGMAYCLWESAGCPTGSADADWYRAEQLIRGRI